MHVRLNLEKNIILLNKIGHQSSKNSTSVLSFPAFVLFFH